MLQIKTTGVEDFVDGSANIKALIIGGPGVGKTRMSSYWPKPIFLDAENGRGSLADRSMPFVEIRTSKDMLDALEYLKMLQRTPKAERQFQTVVVDTADSFQRLVKDEWVQQTKAASFSGYDAWGYLDAKMQLLFTRLLNLDYNVIVAVHYKDKTFKNGEDQVREYVLQLQGAISDQIFNDFGLVGWLGTYWAAGEDGRVQKRGLTFTPTPDKPFLKDRFNVTPKWMEINFDDNDYQQLFEAFFNRPEFDSMPESNVVGEIPDGERLRAQATGPVNPPTEGGALPPRPPAAAPEVPLEKKLKGELENIAKELGLQVRGNMLKGELVEAIKAKRAEGPVVDGELLEPVRHAQEKPVADGGETPANKATSSPPVREATAAEQALAWRASRAAASADPTPPPSSSESSPEKVVDAQPASPAPSSPSGDSPQSEQAQFLTPEQVAGRLGGTVLTEERPAPKPAPTAAARPAGPSACADCGTSLAEEWADPTKKDYIRLSFVKFRRYLCTTCTATATK